MELNHGAQRNPKQNPQTHKDHQFPPAIEPVLECRSINHSSCHHAVRHISLLLKRSNPNSHFDDITKMKSPKRRAGGVYTELLHALVNTRTTEVKRKRETRQAFQHHPTQALQKKIPRESNQDVAFRCRWFFFIPLILQIQKHCAEQ